MLQPGPIWGSMVPANRCCLAYCTPDSQIQNGTRIVVGHMHGILGNLYSRNSIPRKYSMKLFWFVIFTGHVLVQERCPWLPAIVDFSREFEKENPCEVFAHGKHDIWALAKQKSWHLRMACLASNRSQPAHLYVSRHSVSYRSATWTVTVADFQVTSWTLHASLRYSKSVGDLRASNSFVFWSPTDIRTIPAIIKATQQRAKNAQRLIIVCSSWIISWVRATSDGFSDSAIILEEEGQGTSSLYEVPLRRRLCPSTWIQDLAYTILCVTLSTEEIPTVWV